MKAKIRFPSFSGNFYFSTTGNNPKKTLTEHVSRPNESVYDLTVAQKYISANIKSV